MQAVLLFSTGLVITCQPADLPTNRVSAWVCCAGRPLSRRPPPLHTRPVEALQRAPLAVLASVSSPALPWSSRASTGCRYPPRVDAPLNSDALQPRSLEANRGCPRMTPKLQGSVPCFVPSRSIRAPPHIFTLHALPGSYTLSSSQHPPLSQSAVISQLLLAQCNNPVQPLTVRQ